VDKPAGMTSHDVVGRARRLLGTRKVGHAGTLDPMATGLLVLGVGSATRLLTYLVGLGKTYTATIRLGVATTTDDAEGEIIAAAPAEQLERPAIDAAIGRLTGDIEQVPSAVSAIKVDGRRAYDRVRAGEDVQLNARAVRVDRFAVLDERRGDGVLDLDVEVEVSSGTYVRALARDLGADLGVGGHLMALRRTRVGPFAVDEAAELHDRLPLALRPAAEIAAALFPVLRADAGILTALTHGKRPTVDAPDAPIVAVLAPTDALVGLVAVERGIARVLVNFPTEEVVA